MRKRYKIALLIFSIMMSIIIFIVVILKPSNISRNNIITETDNNKNYITCIHYPKTNIASVDEKVKKHINSELSYFKEKFGDSDYLIDRDELNIDYKYSVLNNQYVSLSLTTYINSYKLSNPINRIISYFYDNKNNKYLSLDEIVKIDDLYNRVKDMLLADYKDYFIEDNFNEIFNLDRLKELYFYVDYDYLYLYFNPDDLQSDYYDILTIKIPLNEVKTKIKLSKTISNNKDKLSDMVVDKVIDPTKKVIALTFDDGPSIYTIDIINTLKENDVCATFFILGNKVNDYVDTLNLSIKYGNEIGNHSYNHKWLSRLTSTNFIKQIETTQDIIKDKLNYTPTILRPTYGSVNNRMRKNTNLKIVLWNVDTKDWKIKNINRIIERATTNIRDGDIILMHDVYQRTSKALPKIITILKEQGFQFVTISELEEIKLLRKEITS